MKRTIIILCTICLLALLAGCGAEQTAQEAAPAEPVQTAEPVETAPQEAAAPEAPAEPEPAAEPAAEAEPEEPAAPAEPETPAGLELALSLTGQDTAGLLEQLGEPLSQSYEESCSGPGDDGIWQYEGFIVFTYRENGAETVVDAEAD